MNGNPPKFSMLLNCAQRVRLRSQPSAIEIAADPFADHAERMDLDGPAGTVGSGDGELDGSGVGSGTSWVSPASVLRLATSSAVQAVRERAIRAMRERFIVLMI